jgi:hypothetical protein
MLLSDLQRTAVKNGRYEEVAAVVYYRASQVMFYEESSNPDYEDVGYFTTSEEAVTYASELDVNVGYMAYVDRVTIELEDVMDTYSEDDEFELEDLDNYKQFYTIEFNEEWSGGVNRGKNLDGAIIVAWSWEKHVGYCRKFHGLRYGRYGESEADLADNTERTWRISEEVLLTAEDVQGKEGEELIDAVMCELGRGHWRWQGCPSERVVSEYI